MDNIYINNITNIHPVHSTVKRDNEIIDFAVSAVYAQGLLGKVCSIFTTITAAGFTKEKQGRIDILFLS